MSTPDLKAFVSGYLTEAEEHLGAAATHLLALEDSLQRGEANPRAIRELFRSLHTIKGLSAMVGVDPVVEISHRMESVLRTADRMGGKLTLAAVEVLLEGVRAIESRVRALADKKKVPAAPEKLLAALEALEPDELPKARASGASLALDPAIAAKLGAAEKEELLQGVARGRRALRVDFVPSPARAEQGLTITSVRQRVGELGDIVKVLPISMVPSDAAPGGLAFALLVLTEADDAAVAAAAAASAEHVQPLVTGGTEPEHGPLPEELPFEGPDEILSRRGVVRVEVSRLDEALDRLSSLVVTRFRLSREVAALREKGVDVRGLSAIAADNARQLRDLRASIMSARMISTSELLERVPLIVRGLARTTGKKVRLRIDAGAGELDKSVAERISPAIVHLVRNAIDHGIELPEERRALGKPEEGLLEVTCAEYADNQLELVIRDDGRGIDPERVARQAKAPVPRSDAELLELITRPGLSTMEQATTTSGRGIGMDIIRRIAVEQLGGELLLSSTRGAGTTFTLRLPLTLTIVDAFSFTCGEQVFVVPVSSVEEIVEIDPAQVARTPARGSAGREIRLLQHRGEALPLIDLPALLDLPRSIRDGFRPKALVVRRNQEAMAFEVDRMLGQQEVVVRPIEDPLARVAGVGGTTDLGTGTPTLVLDLAGLRGAVSRRGSENAA